MRMEVTNHHIDKCNAMLNSKGKEQKTRRMWKRRRYKWICKKKRKKKIAETEHTTYNKRNKTIIDNLSNWWERLWKRNNQANLAVCIGVAVCSLFFLQFFYVDSVLNANARTHRYRHISSIEVQEKVTIKHLHLLSRTIQSISMNFSVFVSVSSFNYNLFPVEFTLVGWCPAMCFFFFFFLMSLWNH